jgi:hypothetical protein
MNLIEVMKSENWKYVYNLNDVNYNDHSSAVVVCEFTGGKIDLENKHMSERNDLIVFIPIVELKVDDMQDRDLLIELAKTHFSKYIKSKMPTTYNTSKNVNAELQESSILLKFNSNGKEWSIVIDIADKEKEFFKCVGNFSLVINDDNENYVIRVALGEDKKVPTYLVKEMSFKQRGIDKILDSIIKDASRLKEVGLSNMNMYLDRNGSSDYEVYQSTECKESLPSIRNLNLDNFCYACGKKRVTREHCSPKWLTDKYKVKPLIGNILCADCNNWFGKNYEEDAQNNLKIKNNNIMYVEQRLFISKWCIKTAVTMSIASGVNICNDWLSILRNNEIPQDVKVYFDPGYSFKERGFNYGVSRFNLELSKKGFFLFTFMCTDFLFIVVKDENNVELPFVHQLYPKFLGRKEIWDFSNLPDLHKDIHEKISGEKMVDFSLPTREQGKRI